MPHAIGFAEERREVRTVTHRVDVLRVLPRRVIGACCRRRDSTMPTQATMFAELFGTKVRYSGVSIVYQITSVVAGGLAPLIATALLTANDGDPALVATYVAAVSLLAVIATYFAPRQNLQDIDTDHTEERLHRRAQRATDPSRV